MELQKEISNNIDSVSDGHDGTVIGNGRLVIIGGVTSRARSRTVSGTREKRL